MTHVDQGIKAAILLAVVAVLAPVLMGLSGRRRHSSNPALRFILWGMSALYFPLMSYVLSFLSSYISSSSDNNNSNNSPNNNKGHSDDDEYNKAAVLVAVVLIQFLRAKADMAALAVAAVVSPAAGDDDINSLKIRPSMENLVYSFWVAGLIIYGIFVHNNDGNIDDGKVELQVVALLISPLWLLGAGRMVLRFASFKKATGSFALGRNVQLIDGYMMQLNLIEVPAAGQVPRLIVTGERNRDVEESPMGYRVKGPSLVGVEGTRLVTLDQVWSHVLLESRFKDLCLSFALFKCLRRRFAGYQLAEAGSSWAFRLVADGLLGPPDDHVRVFRVIADELSFARDFYRSPLPVASLGTTAASLHFFISFLILALLCILALLLLVILVVTNATEPFYLVLLCFILATVNACSEIQEIVSSVRSNWTKISIIGHYVRCRNPCAQRILSCLLRCKSPRIWDDEIGQTELFTKPAAGPLRQLFLRWKTRHIISYVVMVPPEVKAAVLTSFRRRGEQLIAGATPAFRHDITWTWACHNGELKITTDVILVWHVATILFEIRFPSPSRASSSSTSTSTNNNNILVAGSLSRYCIYLVAEAPDLLPDNSTWTKRRYEEVKNKTDEVLWSRRSQQPVAEAGVCQQLMDAFNSENSHELLTEGSKLGKQLVEKAEKPSEGDAGAGEDAVWELLAEFWSEMVLYLAPSDNVKNHIEALQRGGELVTLLWALLLHSGVTSRPPRHVPPEP